MDLTFYYARHQSELTHLQSQCTAWLPESQPDNPSIWKPPQVIATCDLSYLFRLRDLIQEGTIAPDKAIWIEIKHQTATGYTFDNDGKIKNFFRIA